MRNVNQAALAVTFFSLFLGAMMLGNLLVDSPSLFEGKSPAPLSPSPLVAGGSGTVISRHVYLQNLSTYNVTLGGSISITGFVMKYDNVSETWVSGINEPLRVFADSAEDATVRSADSGGNFTFPYTLPTGWTDLSINHFLTADIPNSSPYKSLLYNASQYFNVYTDSKITLDSTVLGGHYLLGDSVTLRGTLKNQAETHTIVGQTVNVVIGTSSAPVTTGGGGVFTYPWVVNQENPGGSFSFAGVPDDYLPAVTIPIAMDTLQAGDVAIDSVTIDNKPYPVITYEQTNIQITGTLVLASDHGTVLPSRQMDVTIYNTSTQVTTDAQGKFTAKITVPDGVTTRDLNFTLLYANGTLSNVGFLVPGALTVNSIYDPGNPANPLPYGLIFGLVGVIAAVIIIFVLIRKGVIKLNRARPVYEVNQRTFMDRVNALAAMGRIQEAMAYLLVKYLDALRFRMQMTKKRGQTVRDIATEAVRRHLHQADLLYPWTSFVEAAVYSGRTVTTKDLEQTKAFYQTAQQIVPFSEQELVSLKPVTEPETPPGQAMTKALAPKSNSKGDETKKEGE